jgi:hypothetical protein
MILKVQYALNVRKKHDKGGDKLETEIQHYSILISLYQLWQTKFQQFLQEILKSVWCPVQLSALDSSLVLYTPEAGFGFKHLMIRYGRKVT